jgi:hypothetical protein
MSQDICFRKSKAKRPAVLADRDLDAAVGGGGTLVEASDGSDSDSSRSGGGGDRLIDWVGEWNS